MSDQKKVKRRIVALEQRYQQDTKENHWGAWFSLGWRIALEWAAAVLAGYSVGYVIDWWFNCSPWGLIVFLLLGNVAGLLNIYRTFKNDIKTF